MTLRGFKEKLRQPLSWGLVVASYATAISMLMNGLALIHKAGLCGIVCSNDWYSGRLLLVGALVVGATSTELAGLLLNGAATVMERTSARPAIGRATAFLRVKEICQNKCAS
jgi:hypothetical protein